MMTTRMVLMAGTALAVTTAGAQADDLEALKTQIESLNARVTAMDAAPPVPDGDQLIAVSEGELQQAPGLGMSARELAAYGTRSTIISVLPTAVDPAGATMSWSGFVRSALVYNDVSSETTFTDTNDTGFEFEPVVDSNDFEDLDVLARGEIRVKASTDTAVGEVGVDIRLRGDFNGSGNADIYSDVAWGYWSLTPELTLGGGYAGSLGNIGHGYDGACTCNYTDNADVDFNPGDVTQLRLSYAAGPVSFAVAVEDGSIGERGPGSDFVHGDKLGAAGEITYSGDRFSGEISAVWRDMDNGSNGFFDARWQVGAGLGLALGDNANLSLAAALGESNEDIGGNEWWGVSALASFNLLDGIQAELGAGYKSRAGLPFEGINGSGPFTSEGIDYEAYGILGGVYYTPVDQLTIGLEAEWQKETSDFVEDYDGSAAFLVTDIEQEQTTFSVVSVWRF